MPCQVSFYSLFIQNTAQKIDFFSNPQMKIADQRELRRANTQFQDSHSKLEYITFIICPLALSSDLENRPVKITQTAMKVQSPMEVIMM